MPTATMTWHGPYTSAPAAAGTTPAEFFADIYDALVVATAVGAFPWEICSYDNTDPLQHVCLKRKDASAGRIIILYHNAPVTFNAQLHAGSGSIASGVRIAYVPGATSDVPANLDGSGDVFASGSMFPNAPFSGYMAAITGGFVYVYGSEDGIVFQQRQAAGGVNAVYGAGDLVVDPSDAAAPISFLLNTASQATVDDTTPPTTYASGTVGYLQKPDLTTVYYFGSGQVLSYYPTGLRNNAIKKAWFPTANLCSYQIPAPDWCKYSLRQISMGIVPLAADEVLYTTGPVTKAISLAGNTTASVWLLNFKLNA